MSTATLTHDDPLTPEGFETSAASLLLATLSISILSLALPVMTLQVYDRILPNPGSGTLPVLIVGVCVAVALEAMLRLSRAYILGWSGASYEHHLSCAAMNRILRSDLSRLTAIGIGENLNRMSAIGKLKDFHNGYAVATLSELAFVPLFLVVVAYVAGALVLVPLAVLTLFALVSFLQGKKLRDALKSRDEADDRRYDFLIEALEGVHTLKAFTLENMFARRYEALEEKSSAANYNVTEVSASTFNTGSLFSHLMVSSVIAAGALFVLHGQMTTGSLIATVLLSGRMMQPIQKALGLWARYQDYALARQKVESLFDIPLHTQNTAANDAAPEREGTLEVHDLTFRTADDRTPLIDKVSFKLKHGECVLLSADTDESKIAFLELISGLYPPTAGEIVLDGADIGRYAPERLIEHVGFVRGEGLIFRGTIRDNLTCFGQIPEEKAREAAALLEINRDIARLPSGFDTFLQGNGGDSIPPGLKQRIAMARVIAPKPRFILFDNADRGLDRNGYSLIYDLLARLKGKATMVIVSDDRNIRSLADRFFVLEKGVLAETKELHDRGSVRPYEELRL